MTSQRKKNTSAAFQFRGSHIGTVTQANELYPTPIEATRSLLAIERDRIPSDVWEPAVGKGHISQVLRAHGYRVIETDLNAEQYGVGSRLDFIQAEAALCPAIITNPPYSLLSAFIETALAGLGVSYLALFLPLTCISGKARNALYRRVGYPQRVHAYETTFMIEMGTKGSERSIFPHAWFVWDRKCASPGTTLTVNDWRSHSDKALQQQ